MSEVKQEGEFSLKGKKTKPKNLGETNKEPIKVDLSSKPEEKQEVTKVEIKEPKVETVEDVAEDVITQEQGILEEEAPIVQEITNEVEVVEEQLKQAIVEQEDGIDLPENIEKLVSFMKETGGDINDYVRLNADYSNIDNDTLLKEYYAKTKPYLDAEDLNIILEDFSYDEDLDEERDIRKKKLAYKEEVAKAKGFLEETKSKYYDEIKLRPGVTQDQQKATDFFNRYNKQQEQAEQQHAQFKESTHELFNDNFEGFDIKVGEKSYKYNIQNRDKVAESQSNINNLVGKFLDSDGNVSDTKGYHKAMYAADNVDKIASHFYEQGKADAVKEVVNNSKNLSNTKARSTQGDVFVNGLKVKAISGADSKSLRIKTRKFN